MHIRIYKFLMDVRTSDYIYMELLRIRIEFTLIKSELHIILWRRYKCKANRVFVFALSKKKGEGDLEK